MRLLIERGATIDQADNDGVTPLYVASQNGHEAVVRLLIERGATIDQAENHGWTPLRIAILFDHESVASVLLELGADAVAATLTPEKEEELFIKSATSLHRACSDKDPSRVLTLLRQDGTFGLNAAKRIADEQSCH